MSVTGSCPRSRSIATVHACLRWTNPQFCDRIVFNHLRKLQLEHTSQLFLQYDYAETKDLAKSFLTLTAAILVFSLTLSEKFIDLQKASNATRTIVLLAWASFFSSIALCGLAICFISLAGGQAVYGGPFFETAQSAYFLLVGAGGLFVAGLFALIVATSTSVYRQESQPAASSQLPLREQEHGPIKYPEQKS